MKNYRGYWSLQLLAVLLGAFLFATGAKGNGSPTPIKRARAFSTGDKAVPSDTIEWVYQIEFGDKLPRKHTIKFRFYRLADDFTHPSKHLLKPTDTDFHADIVQNLPSGVQVKITLLPKAANYHNTTFLLMATYKLGGENWSGAYVFQPN